MSKSTTKKRKYNSVIVNELAKHYKFTTQFIRQSLRGDRNSEASENIRKQYKILLKKLEKAVKVEEIQNN